MKTIITIAILISSIAFADTSEELRLADEMKSVFVRNKQEMSSYSPYKKNTQAGMPKGFEELSDSEKLRMIAAYLFHNTGNLPYGSDRIGTLLRTFPETIQDDSELRRLLSGEEDARRFFILKTLASHFASRRGSTYIPEMARMLLRNEPVYLKNSDSEYNGPVFHDVSRGTYESIVFQLKRLNASFEEIPEDRSDMERNHVQRKLHLARWLKENWPGCEDLALPGAGRAVKGGQARPELPAPPVASTSGPGDGEIKENPGKSPPHWAWVSVLAILAAALVAWFRSRLAKT